MRISDWSSDVCSSDLPLPRATMQSRHTRLGVARLQPAAAYRMAIDIMPLDQVEHQISRAGNRVNQRLRANPDRKSVVKGKRVSVRVDLGGGPNSKKKKIDTTHMHAHQNKNTED